MNAWQPIVFLMFAAAFLAGGRIVHVRRRKAMRLLAARIGFTYIGDALPRSFSPSGHPLEMMTAVWNTLDGDVKGLRVLVFDCRMGEGKRSWRRTIIAAKSSEAAFGSIDRNDEIELATVGDWTILYRPRGSFFFRVGMMPIPEIEARVGAISSGERASSPKT